MVLWLVARQTRQPRTPCFTENSGRCSWREGWRIHPRAGSAELTPSTCHSLAVETAFQECRCARRERFPTCLVEPEWKSLLLVRTQSQQRRFGSASPASPSALLGKQLPANGQGQAGDAVHVSLTVTGTRPLGAPPFPSTRNCREEPSSGRSFPREVCLWPERPW